MNDSEVLFTQQEHHADKAGLHYDYRIVIGDKAYSWASFKNVPEPGKSIIFHEQPVHDRTYALSKKVVIPSGQYGGGTTYLKWVKKGKLTKGKDHFTIETANGEKYLLKHIPSYGEKQWLFKNLTEGAKNNRSLEKIAGTYRAYSQHRSNIQDDIHILNGGESESASSHYAHLSAAAKNNHSALSRAINKSKGIYQYSAEKGVGTDYAGRVSPVVHTLKFEKSDILNSSSELEARNKFTMHLDKTLNAIHDAHEPGSLRGFNAGEVRKDSIEFFDKSFQAHKQMHRRIALSKKVAGTLAAVGTIGLVANRLLKPEGKKDVKENKYLEKIAMFGLSKEEKLDKAHSKYYMGVYNAYADEANSKLGNLNKSYKGDASKDVNGYMDHIINGVTSDGAFHKKVKQHHDEYVSTLTKLNGPTYKHPTTANQEADDYVANIRNEYTQGMNEVYGS